LLAAREGRTLRAQSRAPRILKRRREKHEMLGSFQVEKDEAPSDFLRKHGYEAFWDHEVFLETEAVLQRIKDCGLAGGARD